MIERCLNCRGTKKLLGLGGISKECHYCHGVGFVEAPQDDDAILNQKPLDDVVVEIKKSARKKKRAELHDYS